MSRESINSRLPAYIQIDLSSSEGDGHLWGTVLSSDSTKSAESVGIPFSITLLAPIELFIVRMWAITIFWK